MKRRKVISFLTAAVMAASALPISAVSAAEGAYALGDVDMDGIITGHDAAVVSRYLNVDADLLTEEQKKLADVNEDGIVDQADADWIHENQALGIGDMLKTGYDTTIDTFTAYYALCYYAKVSSGYDVEIVKEDIPEIHPELYRSTTCRNPENLSDEFVARMESNGITIIPWDTVEEKYPELWKMQHFRGETLTTISELDYNLLDCDGDGDVDTFDAYLALYATALMGCGLQDKPYFAEGRYDLNADLLRQLMDENSGLSHGNLDEVF